MGDLKAAVEQAEGEFDVLAGADGFLFYAMVACLVVNDAIKVVMIKWRVPTAIA